MRRDRGTAERRHRRWRKLEEAEQEIARLRSEVIRMREREVVLKKSLGILSETPESGMPRLKR